MSRYKRKRRRGRSTSTRGKSAAAMRRRGMTAFRRGDYTQAINTWERIPSPTMQPAPALAEAYFRRGLGHLYGDNPQPQIGLADLQKASTLQSDDPGSAYHLGLAAQRQGDLEEATLAYEIVLSTGHSKLKSHFAARAAYPLALALLQQGKDPAAHPVWAALSPQEQTMLVQVKAFRRRPYKPAPDAPLLYHGVAATSAGEPENARETLTRAAIRCRPARKRRRPLLPGHPRGP